MRAGRGAYVRPIETRFGVRAPSAEKVVEAIASLRGETVVSHGAAAANALGLTTQVPVRVVYLTSGRSRHLKLGAQVVELKHAPGWQLIKAGQPAGEAVRALAWLGPAHARGAQDIEAETSRVRVSSAWCHTECASRVVGREGERRACCEWLKPFYIFPPKIDSKRWASPQQSQGDPCTYWRKMSGSFGRWQHCSNHDSPVILSSRAGRRYRKPTRRSDGSRRISMSPMIFASWPPTLLAMPWKHYQPMQVRRRNGQRRSGSGFQFGPQNRFCPSSEFVWRRLAHQPRQLLRVSPYLLRTRPLPVARDM